jgi:hypothetical protein
LQHHQVQLDEQQNIFQLQMKTSEHLILNDDLVRLVYTLRTIPKVSFFKVNDWLFDDDL